MRGIAIVAALAVLVGAAYYVGTKSSSGGTTPSPEASDGVAGASSGARAAAAPATDPVTSGVPAGESASTLRTTSTPPGGSPARLVGPVRPVFNPATSGPGIGLEPSSPPPTGAEVPGVGPGTRGAAGSPPPPMNPGESGPATQELARTLEEDRRLAWAALSSGDVTNGARRLEQLYAVWKDRSFVDLSAEVTKLVDLEKTPAKKLEYLRYLSGRDPTGRTFDLQLARCLQKRATAETSPEAAVSLWDDLTLSYDMASDRTQKEKVMALVDSFVQDMIFAGRYTPVLKSYTVQGGDSLSTVADQFQTTVDALRRINNLKNDTIQPRQKLRVLPGKVKIFVDKSDFVLWATVDGRILMEFLVGLGRENPTPAGTFVVNVRQKDPTWWRPGQEPLPAGHPENILGTRWMGFKETRDHAGFGIHGTADPSSLGTRSSAGCVRMRKDDVELLYDMVRIGTEVVIQE